VTLTVLVAPPDNVGDVDRGCVLRAMSAAVHPCLPPSMAG